MLLTIRAGKFPKGRFDRDCRVCVSVVGRETENTLRATRLRALIGRVLSSLNSIGKRGERTAKSCTGNCAMFMFDAFHCRHHNRNRIQKAVNDDDR